jgi:hypothetical protein
MDFFEYTTTKKQKIVNGKVIESLEKEKINKDGSILIQGVKNGVPFMFSNTPELKHLQENGLVLKSNEPNSKASKRKSLKKSTKEKSKKEKSKKKKKGKKGKKSKRSMKK